MNPGSTAAIIPEHHHRKLSNMLVDTFHHHHHHNKHHSGYAHSEHSPTESRTSELSSGGDPPRAKSGSSHSDFSSDPSPNSDGGHHTPSASNLTKLGGGSALGGLDLSRKATFPEESAASDQAAGTFHCQPCGGKEFESWHHYKQHVDTEHNDGGNRPMGLPSWTDTPNVMPVDENNGTKCIQCDISFPSSHLLQMHMIQSHSGTGADKSEANQCSFCNVTIPGGPENLLRHKEGHAAAGLLRLSGHTHHEVPAAPISPPEEGLLMPGQSSNPEGKIFNREAYCELCNKEFCNKYFLKTHKANKHGIPVTTGPPTLPNLFTPTFSEKSVRMDSLVESLIASQQEHAAGASPSGGGSTPKISPLQALDMSSGARKDPAIVQDEEKHISPPDSSGTEKSPGLPLPTFFGTGGNDLEARNSPAIPRPQIPEPRCSICHQAFPSAALLQSHFFTAHNPLNTALAMQNLYTASMLNAGGLPSISVASNPMFQANLMRGAFASALGLGGAGSLVPTATSFPGAAGGLTFQQFANMANLNGGMLPADLDVGAGGGGHSGSSNPSDFGGLRDTKSGSQGGESDAEGLSEPGAMVRGAQGGKRDAFCEICQKQFCNKYFLKTHKFNKHGVVTNDSPKGSRSCRKMKSPPQETPLKPFVNQKPEPDLGAKGGPAEKAIKLELPTENSAEIEAFIQQSAENGDSSTTCDVCSEAFHSTFAMLSHKFQAHPNAVVKIDLNADQRLTSPKDQAMGPCGTTKELSNQKISPRLKGTAAALASKVIPAGIDPEAYCEFCKKEFCSKYFLKTHKLNIHGIVSDLPTQVGTSAIPGHSPPPTMVPPRPNSKEPGSIQPSQPEALVAAQSGGVNVSPDQTTPGTGGTTPGKRQVSSGKNFCDICSKELCNKYFLRTHMAKMHGLKIDENKVIIGMAEAIPGYKCGICGKELSSRHFLKLHKLNTHGMKEEQGLTRGPYATGNGPPNMTVSPNTDLAGSQQHGLSGGHHHNSKSSPDHTLEKMCPFCAESFDNFDALKIHLRDDHKWEDDSEDGYGDSEHHLVDVESLDAGPDGAIKSEIRESTDESGAVKSPVKCDFCPEYFPDIIDLQLHNVSAHPVEVEQRAEANMLLKLSRMVTNAIDAIAQPLDFPTAVAIPTIHQPHSNHSSDDSDSKASKPEDESGGAFRKRRRQKMQMTAKGVRMYRCSYCAYSTRWLSNLCVHEKRHATTGHGATSVASRSLTTLKTYTCAVCLRSYRYQHSLQRHMSVHKQLATLQGLQQFQQLRSAAWWSPVRGPNPGGFMGPLAIPSSPQKGTSPDGIKRYRCMYCNKLFKSRDMCKAHMFAVHKRKAIAGPPGTPPRSSSGGKNGGSVSDGSPRKLYRCKMCGFASRVYAALREHLLKVHNYSTPTKRGNGASPVPEKEPASTDLAPINVNTDPLPSNDGGVPGFSDSLSCSLEQVTPEMKLLCQPKLPPQMPVFPPPPGDAERSNSQPFIMQPFVMKEKTQTGVFISSMVYLPVASEVTQPVDAAFTFMPIGTGQLTAGTTAGPVFSAC